MFALPKSRGQRVVLFVVALFFVAAGVGHFTNTAFFVSIMPPWIPWHRELVWLSGVFEVLGGVGILVAATRRLAGWGLLALLLAVYPANIHMALHPELFPDMTPTMLVLRLPLQFVFAGLVWWAMRPDAGPGAAREGEEAE